jgi:hypothetical protein
MSKKKIEESTPKSRKEKILRKIRTTPTDKHRDDRDISGNRKSKHPNMQDRVSPRKTGNNDPTRGRPIEKELGESILFMQKNYDKTGLALREQVEQFEHKNRLYDLCSHMVAVRYGGWKEEGGKYINESGREASKNRWRLVEGRLAPRGKKLVDYKTDWLLEVRGYCERKTTR